jgi:hypothetical protein
MWEGHAIPQPDLGASLLGSSFGDPCRWPAVLTLGPVGLHSSTLTARCISAERRATPSHQVRENAELIRAVLLLQPAKYSKSFRTCKVTNPPSAASLAFA